MLLESVRNMASLSNPSPQPPVGGSPYSRAVQKFSSTNIASSSPAALSCNSELDYDKIIMCYTDGITKPMNCFECFQDGPLFAR